MKKLIFLLAFPLLLGCSKEEDKLPSGIDPTLLGTGASGAWRTQAPSDTTPAPSPYAFTVSTGLGYGAVQLVLAYPKIIGDYARIDFRYNLGRTAPADCTEGTLALSVTDFSVTSFTIQGLYAGTDHAFIACIYDASDNLTVASSSTIARSGDVRRIFTTSATYNGNLAATVNGISFADGIAGADYRCQTLADAASLGGTWEAVLSAHPRRDAINRLTSLGAIYNIKGEQVARNNLFFWDTVRTIPMNYDENGQTIVRNSDPAQNLEEGFIWTGTASDGQRVTESECANWTSASSSVYGLAGNPSDTTDHADWLAEKNIACDKSGHLLCMEAPTAKPGAVTLTATKLSSTQISVAVDFPANTDLLSRVHLVRANGSTYTNVDCNTSFNLASDVKNYVGTALSEFKDATVTDTLPLDGIYHYAACVYDSSTLR